MSEVWYCTREQVKRALDFKETARNNSQVDNAIEMASRNIEGLTHRIFYPLKGTFYYNWPNEDSLNPWKLWLEATELISITTLTAGGVVVASTDYFLEPANEGPPYNRIEIDLESSAVFQPGQTHQRAISVAGVRGYREDLSLIGAVTEAFLSSGADGEFTYDRFLGVGSIIKIDNEYMIVRERTMFDSSVNTNGALTLANNDVTVIFSASVDGFVVGDVIMLDSEKMLVVEVLSDRVVVKRAWDGSILAAHTSPKDVYVNTSFYLERGALGTTAAAHDIAASVYLFSFPSLINEYAVAGAMNTLLQEGSGYARTVGSGDNERESSGKGLSSLEKDVYRRYGRKTRGKAV